VQVVVQVGVEVAVEGEPKAVVAEAAAVEAVAAESVVAEVVVAEAAMVVVVPAALVAVGVVVGAAVTQLVGLEALVVVEYVVVQPKCLFGVVVEAAEAFAHFFDPLVPAVIV